MEKLVKQGIKASRDLKWSWPKDWMIKLLSFCFALFLWYFVSGEDRVDMTVQIPVEIVNLPRNLVVSNQFKNQLDVTVSGPRGLIRGIARQHITRSIDLSKATPGNIVVKNDLDSIRFPRGIKTLRIQPTHIILLLDRLIQKTVQIRSVIGEPPQEMYTLKSIQLEPDSIALSGPEAVVGSISSIKTLPIDLTDLTDSTTKQVSLSLTDKLADLIGEPTVTARIEIADKLVDATVKNILIKVNNLGDNLSAKIAPQTVSVEAQIPYRLNNDGKNLQQYFQAGVSLAGLGPGSHEPKVDVVVQGEGIKIQSFSPEKITAVIDQSKASPKP